MNLQRAGEIKHPGQFVMQGGEGGVGVHSDFGWLRAVELGVGARVRGGGLMKRSLFTKNVRGCSRVGGYSFEGAVSVPKARCGCLHRGLVSWLLPRSSLRTARLWTTHVTSRQETLDPKPETLTQP